jgi:hypothetical protein
MKISAPFKLGPRTILLLCAPVIEAAPNSCGGGKSDLNSDSIVDIPGLDPFSIR